MVMLKCRVCGKEYQACTGVRPRPGIFRWQEVACSPACGAAYIDLIERSRSANRIEQKAEEPAHIEPENNTELTDEEAVG